MDCVRTAVRQKAKSVCLYRGMRKYTGTLEVKNAIEEGLIYLVK